MPATPHISYFISHRELPVTKNSDVWQKPLPLSRNLSVKQDKIFTSHGEYFCAVRTYFENTGFEIISRALSQRLRQMVKPGDIREIRIYLEKHGEFYHPARIETIAGRQNMSFVLNVAVSEAGIQNIREEYHYLKKLNDEFPISFLPRVYGVGEVRTSVNRKIRMFLGDWFEGYHEFHISEDPFDQKTKILVWNDPNNRFYLSPRQSEELYRQVARILTYYYNVESFEQIFHWHHAAGDFVVRIDNTGLDVKLITVRRYGPLFHNSVELINTANNVELILQALLIFFLNLSIRMRLDRLDGVGDVIWADHLAVQSTLTGFLEGLALKPRISLMPDSIDRCFIYYLSACTKKDLYDLGKAAGNTFNRQAPEVPVVKKHLKAHVEALSQAIDRLLNK
jgi:hypothetical protein